MTKKNRLKYIAAAALSIIIGTYGLTVSAEPQENSGSQDNSQIEINDIDTSLESSVITYSQPDILTSSEQDNSQEPVSEDDPVSIPEISVQSNETEYEDPVSEPVYSESSSQTQGSLTIITNSQTYYNNEISDEDPYIYDEESVYEESRDTDPLEISDEIDESTLTSEDWEKIKSGQVSVTINKDENASPFGDLKDDNGGGNDDWIFLVYGIAAITAGAAIIAAVIITTVISKKKRKNYKR